MTPRALVPALMLALVSSHVAGDTIVRRSTGAVVEGTITRSDPQRVSIEVAPSEDAGEPEVIRIPWTDVRSIEPRPDRDSERDSAFNAGRDIWLAHQRLGRHDITGAIRLLEPHAERLMGLNGPVSAELAEGLLAANLWLGDWPRATAAWLALIAAGDHAVRHHWAVPDQTSSLIPMLPPLFGDPEDASEFLEYSKRLHTRMPSGSRGHTLLGLYTDAAQFRSGADPGAIERRHDNIRTELIRTAGRDESLLFVADVVGADVGSAQARDAARERLRSARKRGVGEWAEAWSGRAIGRSLAREPDPGVKQRGLVVLIDTALHTHEIEPVLAAHAWRDAIQTARALDDASTARLLETELHTRFPDFQTRRTPGRADQLQEEPES